MTAPANTDQTSHVAASTAAPNPFDNPPAPAPQPETPAPQPETPPEPSTDLAVASETAPAVAGLDDGWGHDFVEFHGDRLAVRKPTQQALVGFSLASSKFVSDTTKGNITGLFIARHLAPESYERVFSRMLDPDDLEYTVDTIGELMKVIVELSAPDKAG